MSNINKSKKCVKGFPCGYACISRTKQCWANLSSSEGRMAETFSQFVNRLVGIGNDKESSLGNNIPDINEGKGVVSKKKHILELFKNKEFKEKIESSDYYIENSLGDGKIDSENVVYYIGDSNPLTDSSRSLLEDVIDNEGLNFLSTLKKYTEIKQPTHDNVDYNKMAKDFPVDEDNLMKLLNGPITGVSWDAKYVNIKKGEEHSFGKKVALEARTTWKNSVLPTLKEGQILFNTPNGGSKGARARAYELQGFSKVDVFGNQYAIVKNGELIPFEVFPLVEDYPKEGLTKEEFNKINKFN